MEKRQRTKEYFQFEFKRNFQLSINAFAQGHGHLSALRSTEIHRNVGYSDPIQKDSKPLKSKYSLRAAGGRNAAESEKNHTRYSPRIMGVR